MKTLLIGLGQIGLGLIVPVFQKAGYELVGTDANTERLNQLQDGYTLKTPVDSRKIQLDVKDMSEISGKFDLIITSVGRQHLVKVAEWCRDKNISAPVLLAENLPDQVNVFTKQIPIVVDRICPRVIMENGTLTAYAEYYYKIVVLSDPLTYPLGKVENIELETLEMNVELKRKRKMFTVNASHVLASLYGQKIGCKFVDEAVKNPDIALRIESAVQEIGPWLGLNPQQCHLKSKEILGRFGSPLNDELTRILNPNNRNSASRYIEVPLNGLHALGKKPKTLEEAYKLLTA